MQLSVSNFLCIQTANITISGITLLVGNNRAGKSSILRAAAACATGRMMPFIIPSGREILARGNLKPMIYTGQKKATATLTAGDKSITINWSPTTSSVKGGVPVSTNEMATGMFEWMAIPTADRTKLLQKAMESAGIDTLPTVGDLAKEMSTAGVGEQASIDYAWKTIQEKGWDAALKDISERWSEVKWIWQAATGENYGAAKANGWCPPGWDPLLADSDETALSQAIQTAQQALEDGIARKAVDGDTIRRARELAERPRISNKNLNDEISGLQAEIKFFDDAPVDSDGIRNLKGNIQSLADQLATATKELADLDGLILPSIPLPSVPAVSNRNGDCPECETGLFVEPFDDGYKISIAETTPINILETARAALVEAKAKEKLRDESNAKAKKLISATRSGITKIKADKADQETTLAAALINEDRIVNERRSELNERMVRIKGQIAANDQINHNIDQSIANLATLIGKSNNTVTDSEIVSMRADVETAYKRLAMFKAKKIADKESKRITKMGKIREILAPDGLRATKLNEAMNYVTATLTKICTLARWPAITLDSDFNLHMGGFPFALLSKSEQFRCQVSMQILIARLTGSELLLIDGADILDASPGGRIGLVKMLREYRIPTLVTMTEKREYAEKVAKYFDRVYLVADGKADEIVRWAEQVSA